MEEVPSCSCCLARSEPPTNPMATLWRRAERRASISGVAVWWVVSLEEGGGWRGKGTNATGDGEGVVYVEEDDCVFDGALGERGVG